MKNDSLLVIESREDWLGTGDEYLCVRETDSLKFELSIRGYEFLGNVVDFCDDEGEENIPDTINGKEVVEVLSEYIIGGELVTYKDEEVLVFSDVLDPRIPEFLKEHNWINEENSTNEHILRTIHDFCLNNSET
jgi:hypothetical protein